MQKPFHFGNAFHKYASIIVLVVMGIFISHLFQKLVLPRKDFYNELWGPAYLLVRGQSPYDTAVLSPNLSAAWFPMAIGFFFPLGWLSEEAALQAWFLFNIFEICLIVYLLQANKLNIYNTVAMALMCFFFPLTLNHINLGQLAITVTLGWILAVCFLEREQEWAAMLCIALALSKPHLGFLAMLGLSYHDYLQGGLRMMFSSWVRIFFMCVILSAPLFAAYPAWIPDAIVSMRNNPPWLYPSLYILFERIFGTWGYALWGITTLLVLAANFWIWKNLPMRMALYWSLALALLATPYVGSWDFVVLLPLLISTYINVNWIGKTLFWVSYCIGWALMARVQMMEASHNHYFWWVPLWFLVSGMLITKWKLSHEDLA